MPSRAFHQKTRHGCLTCKQRRKKCDLQKPTCQTCRRLCLQCIYEDVLYRGLSPTQTQGGLPTSITYYPHPLYKALSKHSKYFEPVDFELAFHFLQMDSDKLTTIPGLAALRNLDYPSVTARYPYLLHGVLASSALHLASSQTSNIAVTSGKYREKAIRHHQFALSSYIRSLNAIDDQSCQFIFGFSIILAGLQLAFCSALVFEDDESLKSGILIDSIAKMFHLMLGAVSVANEASRWIPTYRPDRLLLPIRSLLQNSLVHIEGEISTAFDKLVSQIHSLKAQNGQTYLSCRDEAAVCISAAMKLRNVFGYINAQDPIRYKVIVGWLAFVDRPYLDLIKARRPMALMVLSYFGIALHSIRSVWWLKIGSKLTLAVDHTLHALDAREWYPLSNWAVSKVLHVGESGTTTGDLRRSMWVDPSLHLESHDSFEVAYGFVCSADGTKDQNSGPIN